MAALVEVAFVENEPHGQMIQGLLEGHGIPSLLQPAGPSGPRLGYGLLNPGGGSRRVMVHAHRAVEARSLLADAQSEWGEAEVPEPVNATYLEDAAGRKPRDYALTGAYARAFLWSIGAMALAFGLFMLLRAV